MKLKKLQNLAIVWILAVGLIFGTRSWAAPPVENILVIYTDFDGTANTAGNYPQQVEAQFYSALLGATTAPNITVLKITNGQNGIYASLPGANLAAKEAYLDSFCQIYDIRFGDKEGNAYVLNVASPPPDYLTFTGPNSDAALYEQFLSVGGSMYVQGEHTDYRTRNTTVFQFIADVATSPIGQQYPGVHTGAGYVIPNTAFTGVFGFATNFNNLTTAGTTIIGNYAGGISAGNYGSGQSITNITLDSGAGSMALAWEGGALKGAYGAGKLVVGFETNALGESGVDHTYSDQWIQNLYTLLSGCVHYTITKTFIPGTLCVGSPGVFTLCYANTGTRAMTNYTISDTIPTCLTYTGSTPALTGSNGASHLYWWTIPNIPAGSSGCVTVNFNATSFPPCP